MRRARNGPTLTQVPVALLHAQRANNKGADLFIHVVRL